MPSASRFAHHAPRRTRNMGDSVTDLFNLPDLQTFGNGDFGGSQPVMSSQPSFLQQLTQAMQQATVLGTTFYQDQAAINTAQAQAAAAGRIANAGADATINRITQGGNGVSVMASTSPSSLMPILLIGGLAVVLLMTMDKHR